MILIYTSSLISTWLKKKGNIIWTFWYDLTKSEQNVLDTNSGTLRIHSSISHSVQIPSNIWWEKKKAGLGACLCLQRDEEARMRGKHWICHSLPSTHAGTDATCSLAISFAPSVFAIVHGPWPSGDLSLQNSQSISIWILTITPLKSTRYPSSISTLLGNSENSVSFILLLLMKLGRLFQIQLWQTCHTPFLL